MKTFNGTACILWPGSLCRGGYGKCRINGRSEGVHRAVYIANVGPIQDGLAIDHLCKTRNCINPLHMEAVTPAVNALRGDGPAARNANKTQCGHGHELAGENLMFVNTKHGRVFRVCRICTARRRAKYYKRKRETQVLSNAG
jgi:hypothetical protein